MVMQDGHKNLYWFRSIVPYVQFESQTLYYLAPKVLVVEVTSRLREREGVPGLGLGSGSVLK